MSRRNDRIANRQANRTKRAELKYGAKEKAYEMGIDPDAAKWQAIADVGKAAADVTGAILDPTKGAKPPVGGDYKKLLNLDPTQGAAEGSGGGSKNNTILLVAGAALVLFFMFKKK